MVPDIVFHLYSENMEIKLQSSLAIFKCASNKVSVRQTHIAAMNDERKEIVLIS